MGNVNMEASQINYRGGEIKMSVEEALKNTAGEAAAIAQLQTDVANLASTKASQMTIAPFFNPEVPYDVGDLVYYNGLSYRCTNAHEGEWDADDFAATTIAGELDDLKSGLNVSQTGQSLSDLAAYLSTLTTTQKCRSVLKVEFGTNNIVMPIYTYNPVEYQLTNGGGSANIVYDMYQYYNGAFRKFRKKNDLTIETTDLSEDVTGWAVYISA